MKKLIHLCIALLITSFSFGQTTLRPNIYYTNMNYYNVAAVQMQDSQQYSISLYTKYRFVNDETYNWTKPPIFFLNHIGTVKKRKPWYYNVGFITDQYSFYSRNTIYAGYTHVFQLNKKGNHSLSIGARLVLNMDILNWNKFTLPTNETGRSLKPNADMDIGVNYRFKNFTLAISSKNLASSFVKLDRQKLLINQREFYFYTSYLFPIKKNFELAPFLLVRRERNNELDLGLHTGFYKRVDVSYQIRLIKLRHIFTVQGRITKSLSIGAAFDISNLLTDKNIDACIKYAF